MSRHHCFFGATLIASLLSLAWLLIAQANAHAGEPLPREGSWVSEIQLPSGFGPENGALQECCFDYAGTEAPDDGLGALISLLGTFEPGVDVATGVNQSIVEDRFTILVDWLVLPDVDGDVSFRLFSGIHTEDTSNFGPQGFTDLYTGRLVGDFDFSVLREETVVPFTGSRTGNSITAGPSQFPILIDLPVFGTVRATLLDALIEAELDPGGINPPETLTTDTPEICVTSPCVFYDHVDGMRVGGVIAMEEFVANFDAQAVGERNESGDIIDPSGACACAWGEESDGSDSVIPSDFAVVATNQLGRLLPGCTGQLPHDGTASEPPAGFTCTEQNSETCANIRLVCTSGSALGLAGVPDVDLPGGEAGVLDGISVGLYASVTGATLIPEPSAGGLQLAALATIASLTRWWKRKC